MSLFAQALLYMLGINALSWLAGFIMGRLTAPHREVTPHMSVTDMAYRLSEESNVVQLRREG